jgi:hypothetical protein
VPIKRKVAVYSSLLLAYLALVCETKGLIMALIGTSAVDGVYIPDVPFTLPYKDTTLCLDDEIRVGLYLLRSRPFENLKTNSYK